jgi:hypothetical protein
MHEHDEFERNLHENGEFFMGSMFKSLVQSNAPLVNRKKHLENKTTNKNKNK